eukprot:6710340-Alexandrium_andersonii.AAC.1
MGLAGLRRKGDPAQALPVAGTWRPAGRSARAGGDKVAFGEPRLDSAGQLDFAAVPGLGQVGIQSPAISQGPCHSES